MQEKELETFCPKSRADWRDWLEKNHNLRQSIWLIYYKKKSEIPSIIYSEAVDEAICFGWIDSTKKSLDKDRFMQFFSKRKDKSTWSRVNKEKVQKLTADGLMTKAGLEIIDTAKKNGSWTILDDVEDLKIPIDLEKEFEINQGSKEYFLNLSKSIKKAILQRLVLTKLPETRQKRIAEIIEITVKKIKPKQF